MCTSSASASAATLHTSATTSPERTHQPAAPLAQPGVEVAPGSPRGTPAGWARRTRRASTAGSRTNSGTTCRRRRAPPAAADGRAAAGRQVNRTTETVMTRHSGASGADPLDPVDVGSRRRRRRVAGRRLRQARGAIRRAARALGRRPRDVAGHAAEHHGVEGGDAPPVGVAQQAARMEQGALPVAGTARRRRVLAPYISSQARPGSRISARSRSSRPGSISSTRQKSSESPTRSRAASRRPRRSPTPPDQPVQPPPHRPGEREGVPAVVAADALDHPPQRLAGRVDGQLPRGRV